MDMLDLIKLVINKKILLDIMVLISIEKGEPALLGDYKFDLAINKDKDIDIVVTSRPTSGDSLTAFSIPTSEVYVIRLDGSTVKLIKG